MVAKSTPETFWARVDKSGYCWLWQGAVDRFGYGWLRYHGRLDRGHRLAYELTHGKLPEGACVLHRCDAPRCVRPDHLFLGTRADNHRDMVAKARARSGVNPPIGERNASARLTAETARAAREEYRRGGCTTRSLAAKYGVAQATVADLVRGKTWKHLA